MNISPSSSFTPLDISQQDAPVLNTQGSNTLLNGVEHPKNEPQLLQGVQQQPAAATTQQQLNALPHPVGGQVQPGTFTQEENIVCILYEDCTSSVRAINMGGTKAPAPFSSNQENTFPH